MVRRALWWTGNEPARLQILVLFVDWSNNKFITAPLTSLPLSGCPANYHVKWGMWHRRTAEDRQYLGKKISVSITDTLLWFVLVFLLRLIWKDKQPVAELSHSKHIITMAVAVSVSPGLIEKRQAGQWNSGREPHRRYTLAANNGPGGWLTPKTVAEAQERGWRDWCVHLKYYSHQK